MYHYAALLDNIQILFLHSRKKKQNPQYKQSCSTINHHKTEREEKKKKKKILQYNDHQISKTIIFYKISIVGMRVCQEIGFHNFIHPNSSIFPMFNIFFLNLHIPLCMILTCDLAKTSTKSICLKLHLMCDAI